MLVCPFVVSNAVARRPSRPHHWHTVTATAGNVARAAPAPPRQASRIQDRRSRTAMAEGLVYDPCFRFSYPEEILYHRVEAAPGVVDRLVHAIGVAHTRRGEAPAGRCGSSGRILRSDGRKLGHRA